ncbi:hypothetical protein O7606_03325 [Micromonospora sp. WMMD882]|uniref:hypothetical protein n=1 Tax=Micromonospora sp. WMMD882 TaxID=3015151 RepID=UPI00248B0C55|nr:hypothetical protein [Micromonospora sp. WMMD882]WBB80427.1 hypothetical protein O7606_03325 [Micromonospora sp. WMMD882]
MRKIRRILQAVLSGAAATLLVALAAQPAAAWTWSPVTTVYSSVSSSYCVRAQAGIDHFVPGSLSGNLAYANAYLLRVRVDLLTGFRSCELSATGWGRARLDVERWNGSTWTFCRGSGWAYGSFGWSGGEFPGPYGPSQILDYGGSSSCGQGYYRTRAFAEYETSPSTWVGGNVVSGYEWVP